MTESTHGDRRPRAALKYCVCGQLPRHISHTFDGLLIRATGRPVTGKTGGTWGGPGRGGGRKPKLEDARNVTVYLSALHVHWLERHGRSNRASTLRALIDADIAAHQPLSVRIVRVRDPKETNA
jgi:hypothetical protein